MKKIRILGLWNLNYKKKFFVLIAILNFLGKFPRKYILLRNSQEMEATRNCFLFLKSEGIESSLDEELRKRACTPLCLKLLSFDYEQHEESLLKHVMNIEKYQGTHGFEKEIPIKSFKKNFFMGIIMKAFLKPNQHIFFSH